MHDKYTKMADEGKQETAVDRFGCFAALMKFVTVNYYAVVTLPASFQYPDTYFLSDRNSDSSQDTRDTFSSCQLISSSSVTSCSAEHPGTPRCKRLRAQVHSRPEDTTQPPHSQHKPPAAQQQQHRPSCTQATRPSSAPTLTRGGA